MNIFYLSQDPVMAAQYHCDQHQSKMILESAQIMCANLYLLAPELYNQHQHKLYKPFNPNHGSTKWARECAANYEYLYKLVTELNRIHTIKSYGITHRSYPVFQRAHDLIVESDTLKGPWIAMDHTPPYLAIQPRRLIVENDLLSSHHKTDHELAVLSYRTYYRYKQIMWHNTRTAMTFRRSLYGEPKWLQDMTPHAPHQALDLTYPL